MRARLGASCKSLISQGFLLSMKARAVQAGYLTFRASPRTVATAATPVHLVGRTHHVFRGLLRSSPFHATLRRADPMDGEQIVASSLPGRSCPLEGSLECSWGYSIPPIGGRFSRMNQKFHCGRNKWSLTGFNALGDRSVRGSHGCCQVFVAWPLMPSSERSAEKGGPLVVLWQSGEW